MAPKKRKAENITLDIRTFYKKKSDIPVSGTPSTKPRQMTTSQMPQMRVKEEQEAGVLVNGHTHLFKMKFGSEDRTYNISCDRPRTLLEAIKSHLGEEFNEKIKCADENIIIKRGKGDNSSLVATHFPCSCLREGECLTIRASTKVVEAQRKKKYQIQEKERYTVFYIDKEGGKDSKSKANQIFRCSYIAEEFKYFCVYNNNNNNNGLDLYSAFQGTQSAL
ncbi:uncharacterized protein LOC121639423, partial [Melanotaenia boesemani]|uniref:uncharacterized protein LOC121639423 n=1 Tax=Melanotaenia boesemani TaxID=1250792 RepID=UPI001C051347